MIDLLYGALGGVIASIICYGIGYVMVILMGVPEGRYFGFGIEPWNLPGTILGLSAWGAIMFYRLRKK